MNEDLPRTLVYKVRDENGNVLFTTGSYTLAKEYKQPNWYISTVYPVRQGETKTP